MTLESCWGPTGILLNLQFLLFVCLCAVQGQLDALEQRMLSKMDRALAKFLEKQLGMPPTYMSPVFSSHACFDPEQ